MQRGKTLVRAVIGVLLTGAVGLASPAPASAVTDGGPPPSYNDGCFGYVGTFKTGTTVHWADYNGDGNKDECFGIAPSRTIWHAWPGSGGWKEMPNNGRADDIVALFRQPPPTGRPTIEVYVSGSNHYYCSTLTSSWQPWVRCP
ncbi:hypothetical protein [Krasilnikovia sp. MM14-A1259]|uniref:hypothetical protein n=1 Tax=Krasilnikovia sp. MM14-A1259 TaxID=3373539 RepID=UPI0038150994